MSFLKSMFFFLLYLKLGECHLGITGIFVILPLATELFVLIKKQKEIREMVFQLHLKRENEERKKLAEEQARHVKVLEEIAKKRKEFEIQIFEEKGW